MECVSEIIGTVVGNHWNECRFRRIIQPAEAQLRNYVKKYLQNTSLTEPDIDIKIDFFQLWQTPGYQDIAEAERVSLCDTVHVYISKLM